MNHYIGKTILKIDENDNLNGEQVVTIFFTDGSKICVLGRHPYDYVSLEVIEGRWGNHHNESVTNIVDKEII